MNPVNNNTRPVCEDFWATLSQSFYDLSSRIANYVRDNKYTLFFLSCAGIAASANPVPVAQSSIILEAYTRSFAYGVTAVAAIKAISLMLVQNRATKTETGSSKAMSDQLQTLLAVIMVAGSYLNPATALCQVSFCLGVKIAAAIHQQWQQG